MGRKNIDVVKAWSRGQSLSSFTGNFRTDGVRLWSYELLIGTTVGIKKVLALYRAPGDYISQTTSQHVGNASRYSDCYEVSPAIFHQYGFNLPSRRLTEK